MYKMIPIWENNVNIAFKYFNSAFRRVHKFDFHFLYHPSFYVSIYRLILFSSKTFIANIISKSVKNWYFIALKVMKNLIDPVIYAIHVDIK